MEIITRLTQLQEDMSHEEGILTEEKKRMAEIVNKPKYIIYHFIFT